MPSAKDLVRISTAAAERAGAYLRSAARPQDPSAWGAKGPADWVTEVDRGAEALIAEMLLQAEPGSTIVGEELTPSVTTAGLVWIVDPLDGTTNFLHGFPAFAVSIAAAIDGVLESGVVLHVPLNRLSHAIRGGGAWEGSSRLSVSPITSPGHALIGTGFPFKNFDRFAEYVGQLTRIARSSAGIRRAGAAALDLADVAAGRYEGFWEQRLAPWDIAAGTLLIREAGGIATNFEGRPLGIEHSSVVAGNPAIHEWMMRVLSTW